MLPYVNPGRSQGSNWALGHRFPILVLDVALGNSDGGTALAAIITRIGVDKQVRNHFEMKSEWITGV
jgi:hypothetical protein